MASRRLKGILLLLLLPLSLFSSELDGDSAYALRALYNGAIAVIASQVNAAPVELNGVTIEMKNEEGNEYLISFNRSDISRFKNRLSGENGSWYKNIISGAVLSVSPLVKIALSLLEEYDYQDALLDGVIDIKFEKPIRGRDIFNILFAGNIDNLNMVMTISMLVTKKGRPPVVFEGQLTGEGDRANRLMRITTDHMTCDGRAIVIKPMEIKM